MENVKLVGALSVKTGKSKTGKPYYCLCCDLGYTTKALTFDLSLIAELLGMSVVELVAKFKGN